MELSDMMGERLRDDESGLSPVLGVVMLLGITVVLAATIGAFAFELQADMAGPTPQVSITAEQGVTMSTQEKVEYTGPNTQQTASVRYVEFTHTNGESIDTSNLYVTVNNKQAYSIGTTSSRGIYPDFTSKMYRTKEFPRFPFEKNNGEMKKTFSLGDSIRIVHGHHSSLPDDPSSEPSNRGASINNNVDDVENAALYPSGADTKVDVTLDTGDVIRLIYTSESGGGGEVLFEHTVV